MRIGIDAHIILPQHKRYNPKIARYTEQLIDHLVGSEEGERHTWILFFDERTKDLPCLEKYKKLKNVEVKKFPFVQYRQYLPVVYSHMLISGFLVSAKLDVFHSPEGLIPFMYPGKIITDFFYVPRGVGESGLFSRTFMLGARVAFSQLCRRARRIIVNTAADKKILVEKWKYPEHRATLIEEEDIARADWPKRVQRLMGVYKEVVEEKTKPKQVVEKAKK